MARKSDLVAHLSEVPLFAKCSNRDLGQVAKELEVVEYPAGAAIVRQGDMGDSFFVLLEGEADVNRNGHKVATLGGGSFFGELSLLDPAPRNADVVASTAVEVARLTVGPFRKLLRDVPAMNERLLAGLARRLHEADRRDQG